MNFFDTFEQYQDGSHMYTWRFRRCRKYTGISYLSDTGFRVDPIDGSFIMGETQNRRIDIEPNYKGHPELQITSGDGYLLRVHNLDTKSIQITTKPMRVIEENENYIVFRGYNCKAFTLFGSMDTEADDFGVIVLLDGDNIRGILVKRYDTGVFYGYGRSNSDLSHLHLPGGETPEMTWSSEGESFISQSISSALSGDIDGAMESARNALDSFADYPKQVKSIVDFEKCALVLGNYLVPDGHRNRSAKTEDVMIVFYFLMKAIEAKKHLNPLLYAYKFLIEYHFNQQMVDLLKRAGVIPLSRTDSRSDDSYYLQLDRMMLGDVQIEKRLRLLDTVEFLYREMLMNYEEIDEESLADDSLKYSARIYNYVSQIVLGGNVS